MTIQTIAVSLLALRATEPSDAANTAAAYLLDAAALLIPALPV